MLSEPSNVAVTSRSGGGAMPEPVNRRATTRHHLPSIIRRSRTPKTGAAAVAKNDASRTGASPVAKTGASPSPAGETGASPVDKTGSPSSSVEAGESPVAKTGVSFSPRVGVSSSAETDVSSSSVTPTTNTGSSSSSKTGVAAVTKTGSPTIAKSSVQALQTATSAPKRAIVERARRTANKVNVMNGAPEAKETETSAPRHVFFERLLQTANKIIVVNGTPGARGTETVPMPRVVHAEPTTADNVEGTDEEAVDIEGALFIDETAYEAESATKIVGSSRDFDSAASLLDACYKQLVADAKASDPGASKVKVVLKINKVAASDGKACDGGASNGKAVLKGDKVKASDAKANSVEAPDAEASKGTAFDVEAVLKVNKVKTPSRKAANAKASVAEAPDARASDRDAVTVVTEFKAGLAGKRLKSILREHTARVVRVVDMPARRVSCQDTSSQTRLFSFVDNTSIVGVKEDDQQYNTIIPTKYKSTSATAPPAKAPVPPPPAKAPVPPPPTPSPPPPDPLPLLGMTRLIVGDTALPLFARAGRVMVEIPGQMLADRGFFDDSTPTDGRRPSLTLGDDTLAMEKVDGKYVVEVPKRLLESLAETRTAEGTAPDPEGPPTKIVAVAAAAPKTGRRPAARLKSAKLKDNVGSQAGAPKSPLTAGSASTVPVVPLEPLTVVVNGSEANGFTKTSVGSNDGFLRRALQKKSSEGPPNKKKRTLAAQSDSPDAHTPKAIKTPVAQSNSRVAGSLEAIKTPEAQSDTLDADSPEAISTPEAQGGVLEVPPHYLSVGVGGHRRGRAYKSSKRRKVEKMFRELAQPEVPLPGRTRRSSRVLKVAEGNSGKSERNSGQVETSSEGPEEHEMPEVPPGGSTTLLGLLAPSGISIQTAVDLEVGKMLGEGTSQEEPIQSPRTAPDTDLGKSLPDITTQIVRLTPAGEQVKGIKRRKPSGLVSKPTSPPVAKSAPPVAKPTPSPPAAKSAPPLPVAVAKPAPKLKLLIPKSMLSVSYSSLPVAKSTVPVPKLKWLVPKPKSTSPVPKTVPPPAAKSTPSAKMPKSTRRGARALKAEAAAAASPVVVETSPTPDEAATTAAQPAPSVAAPVAPAAAPDNGVGIRQVNDRLLRAAFEDWTDCVKRDELTGNIPLHEAVLDGDVAAVRKQCALLLARKASVDVLNNDRETPLHLALKLRLAEAVRELRRRGARLAVTDDVGNTALHLAVVHGLPDGVATLLEGEGRPGERPPLEVLNDEGYAPLHLTALHNSIADAETLLKHKADVDQKDAKSGRTALFIAVENGLKDVVRLLLRAGAGIAEQNYSGQTPMSAANELGDSLLLS